MKNLLSMLFLFGNICTIYAQMDLPKNIQVESSPAIDSLIQKRIKLYSIAGAVKGRNAYNPTFSKGFRVQIFYGINRKEVFEKQSQFRSLFPNMGTYLDYKEPNYYLKVGDFRTRQEAQDFLPELQKYFKTTFIKYEKINPARLKPLEDDTQTED